MAELALLLSDNLAFEVLNALAGGDGDVAELARRTGATPAQLRRVLDRLARAGLIERYAAGASLQYRLVFRSLRNLVSRLATMGNGDEAAVPFPASMTATLQ